jgi:hypothetical protein
MFECLIAVLSVVLPQDIPPAAYSRIERGMTRMEVYEIVGRPSLGVLGAPGSLHGTLTSMIIEAEGEVWRAPRFTLWVLFNEDGRVTGHLVRYGKFR